MHLAGIEPATSGTEIRHSIQLSHKCLGLLLTKTLKMIQSKTILRIADNSGARAVRCIKVLNGFRRKFAKIGDLVVVSVQQLRTTNRKNSKVLKGGVYRALIIRTNRNLKKKDGSIIKLSNNSAILLNKQGNLIGTRILSTIPKLLKKKKFLKYFSICPGTF